MAFITGSSNCKEHIYDASTKTASLDIAADSIYAFKEMERVEVNSVNAIGIITFYSGNTPTNFIYPDVPIFWKGDDCEDYVFVPQANMYYETVIQCVNGVTTGYASAFEVEVSADE